MSRYLVASVVGGLLVAASSLSIAGAQAAPAGAAACAAKLNATARLIYNTVAPQVPGNADLRGLITDRTRSLVISGQISRSDARPAAEAAGQCLEQLRT